MSFQEARLMISMLLFQQLNVLGLKVCTWAAMSAVDRAKIVAKMAQGIEDNKEMLAEIEAADVSKPFRQAAMTLGGAANEGKYWCSLGKALDEEQDSPVNSGGGKGGLPPEELERCLQARPYRCGRLDLSVELSSQRCIP